MCPPDTPQYSDSRPSSCRHSAKCAKVAPRIGLGAERSVISPQPLSFHDPLWLTKVESDKRDLVRIPSCSEGLLRSEGRTDWPWQLRHSGCPLEDLRGMSSMGSIRYVAGAYLPIADRMQSWQAQHNPLIVWRRRRTPLRNSAHGPTSRTDQGHDLKFCSCHMSPARALGALEPLFIKRFKTTTGKVTTLKY